MNYSILIIGILIYLFFASLCSKASVELLAKALAKANDFLNTKQLSNEEQKIIDNLTKIHSSFFKSLLFPYIAVFLVLKYEFLTNQKDVKQVKLTNETLSVVSLLITSLLIKSVLSVILLSAIYLCKISLKRFNYSFRSLLAPYLTTTSLSSNYLVTR